MPTEESDKSFVLFECSLLRQATGLNCTNLRELLEAIRSVPDAVLEHHMMRCALEDHFELNEFPNDIARWCWDALGDHVLGEQLGLVDPYQYHSIADLRTAMINTIEGQLWELQRVPWTRPGLELHLIESRLVSYDTGERYASPAALAGGIRRFSKRSLYYHVHEARRRTGGQTDDFSSWLEEYGAEKSLIHDLRKIDFYFLNLEQLRGELLNVFASHLRNPEAILQVIS